MGIVHRWINQTRLAPDQGFPFLCQSLQARTSFRTRGPSRTRNHPTHGRRRIRRYRRIPDHLRCRLRIHLATLGSKRQGIEDAPGTPRDGADLLAR